MTDGPSRREFFRKGIYLLAGLTAWVGFHTVRPGRAGAQTNRVILDRSVRATELAHENPARLDIRNLEVTPIADFHTMGQIQTPFDVNLWRLNVAGTVKRPVALNYEQLTALPSMEMKALLICPGFFSFSAVWKGISLATLAGVAEMEDGATGFEISSSPTPRPEKKRVTMAEVRDDRVFLAYSVNGQPLPEKHGHPLRMVARDRYGSEWLKYVVEVRAIADPITP